MALAVISSTSIAFSSSTSRTVQGVSSHFQSSDRCSSSPVAINLSRKRALAVKALNAEPKRSDSIVPSAATVFAPGGKMASLCLIPVTASTLWKSPNTGCRKQARTTPISCTNDYEAKSFFLGPSDERIIKKALKEPVAFMGGMFAGLLRLDLNEDPLKEWVSRTVEASGIAGEETSQDGEDDGDVPQQIEIE